MRAHYGRRRGALKIQNLTNHTFFFMESEGLNVFLSLPLSSVGVEA